jgi:hypothetical protein
MLPRKRIFLAGVLVLFGLGVGLVVVLDQLLPWVDVRARVEGQDVVFDIPHIGIEGIQGFRVEDTLGRSLWTVDLCYDKGHRITYGTLPAGGNMPARQILPTSGAPEDIRGRRVRVWVEYLYMVTAPCRGEFQKELDIPQ